MSPLCVDLTLVGTYGEKPLRDPKGSDNTSLCKIYKCEENYFLAGSNGIINKYSECIYKHAQQVNVVTLLQLFSAVIPH